MSKISQLSLKANFSWNFIGNLVYSFSQFVILMLLAKLGNPTMVGLYSIGLAITAPIINLTKLQLRQIQATDNEHVNYSFNDYFGLRIFSGAVMLIITLLIVVLSNYGIEKSIIVLLVGLTKVFDSYSDIIYGQLQQNERMDYIGKSRIIKGISTILIMSITLFLIKNLILALLVLNFTWLIIFLVYDRKKIKLFVQNIKPSFKLSKFKGIVILAFPLGIILMINSLNTNLPRIIVEHFLGEEALGYFASIAYLLVAGNTFIQAVGQAATPRMAKLYRSNLLKNFKKIMSFLILLGGAIGLIGVLITTVFGKPILTLVYDGSYAAYNQLLILVMVSGIFTFSNSFLGHTLTAMRLFKIQPIIGTFGLLVTIVCSVIFIPIFGLKGAAYTLILASVIRFTLNFSVIAINLKLNHY